MTKTPTERLRQVQTLPEDDRARRALLDAAADPSLQVARAALARLARSGGGEEAAVLRERLLAADPGLVRTVAVTLRELGDGAAAAERAIAGLRDDSPSVRMNAAAALRELDHPARSLALRAALGDEIAGVRRTAAEALGGRALAQPDVAALADRLADHDATVRAAAVRALARSGLGHHALRRVSRDPSPAVRLELARHANLLEDDLVRALGGDIDADVRAQTLWILVNAPRRELNPLAVGALSDPAWRVRRAACRAVAAAGLTGASMSLVHRLVDPHETVRAAASRALNELFGADVVGVLAEALPPADARLRRALIYTAAEADATRAFSRVATYAGDEDPHVRTAVVHLAARALTEEAAALLRRLLSDEDPGVAHAARTALDMGCS